jgi:hypothetical protein
MTSEKIVVLNREGLHVARKFCVVGTMAATAFLWVGTATAIPTEEASLNACQNAVKTAAARQRQGRGRRLVPAGDLDTSHQVQRGRCQ